METGAEPAIETVSLYTVIVDLVEPVPVDQGEVPLARADSVDQITQV